MRVVWLFLALPALILTSCVFGAPKAVTVRVVPERISARTNEVVADYVARNPFRVEDVGFDFDIEAAAERFLADIGDEAVPFRVEVRCSLEGESIVLSITTVFLPNDTVVLFDGVLVNFLGLERSFTCSDGGRSFQGYVFPGGTAVDDENVQIQTVYANKEELRAENFPTVPEIYDPMSDFTELVVRIRGEDDGYTPPNY